MSKKAQQNQCLLPGTKQGNRDPKNLKQDNSNEILHWQCVPQMLVFSWCNIALSVTQFGWCLTDGCVKVQFNIGNVFPKCLCSLALSVA